MNQDILDVYDLKTYFPLKRGTLKAVDGVSLRIREKEAVGLVGESGCGKSMTAYSIMRVVPEPGEIVGGRVLLKGKNLLDLTEDNMRKIRGKEISMVFQDPTTFLNPIMRVGTQIAEMISLHQGGTRKEVEAATIQALSAVRMPSPSKVYTYYAHQLSGGMCQRVLIAMAISCQPSLLIADEPTTALDVTVQAQILELIKELRDEFATSLLLVSHNLGVVVDICDTVYVMYAGKIVESASTIELFRKPAHPYTQALLKCVPSIRQPKGEIVSIPGLVPDLADLPMGCSFHPRCPCATKRCVEKAPPHVQVGAEHSVRCWLYS